MIKKLRVLYIERTDKGTSFIETFEKNLVEIVKRMGYEAVLTTKAGKTSPSEIKKLLDDDAVDIIFCDLSLGADDYDGLTIINTIKKDFPEVVICGYSGSDISYAYVSTKVPGFDFFVDKSQRHDKYLNYCAKTLSDLININVHIDIDLVDGDRELKKLVNSGEFQRLLKKITFTTHDTMETAVVSKAQLIPLKGGYSSSKVFKMHCFTTKGIKIINAVLKYSPVKNAEVEINNYLKYVKWYLPYTWKPEMLAASLGKKYGMICYSFAYNDDKQFSSLTDKILAGDSKSISLAIEKIFADSEAGKKWYADENRETVTKPINDFYVDFYFKRYDQKPYPDIYNHIKKLLVERGGYENAGQYFIKDVVYPSAKSLLLDEVAQSYITCILHGDLNSNNIMISEDEEIIFIDFQETGIGHVFHDFIVFEMCLKLYYNTNLDFSKRIEIETMLSKNENELTTSDPIILMMQKVRRAAYKNMPEENPLTYCYGLAMRAFRLLKPNPVYPFESWQNEALLACLLSNMSVLKVKKNDTRTPKTDASKQSTNTSKKTQKTMNYETSLSFANEYRIPFIENLAMKLAAEHSEEKVFYDFFDVHREKLNGYNADLSLPSHYVDDSKVVCVFMSDEYNKKQDGWCGVEWNAIRTRLPSIKEKVLFFTFDGYIAPGLNKKKDGIERIYIDKSGEVDRVKSIITARIERLSIKN